jgi:hypothetical protein
MISHRKGLVATIYPNYFNNGAAFGNLMNCFVFMMGFDDAFMERLGVKAICPEELGWTRLQTKDEWISEVNSYFNPDSSTHRDACFYVSAICFPLIQGATDCHWAVYNGNYWLEQEGRQGPINVWATVDGMIEDVYNRGDDRGKYYVVGSHFYFQKRIY